MKYIYFIVSLFSVLNAQVGINTSTPKEALDIQGALTIRGHLRVNGTDINEGNTGRNMNLLVSNGENKAPEWKSLKIPVIQPKRYYLLYTDSFNDRTGVRPATVTGASTYNYGMTLPSNWSVISGLTKQFTVTNTDSKAYFLYEAVAHINSASQYSGVDFACGIFVDNALIGVRSADLHQATAATYPFLTYTLMATSQSSLSVGTHEVKVACTRRANYGSFTGNLAVGTNATGATNIDNFMAQSSLKIEVFEVPSKFLNIVNE
ncbi:hypothetical protein [Chishuiella sp.]|uniref:hypothetical protein n=1 Tax=Chishuiella sp. TaxID=1969467 RepID=UPI0028A6E4F9|nr:hypothetical protein [Chishuiella sp.]